MAIRLPFILLLLVALCSMRTWAQPARKAPDVKFGQVSAADFVLKPEPNDTTAEAVVLYESADTRFEYRNERIQMVTYFFSRIRINKKSGYDQATVEIPLRGTGTTAAYTQTIEGITYTLQNGQVVKLN